MSSRLLPYETIIKAHEGAPIAIQAVLDRYAWYIRCFSKMNGYYNSDMEDQGENFYANHGLIILDAGKVVFGDNVFIAPSCGFHTSGHPIDFERRNQGLEYAYPITVGNNVWIGAGVQVMPGVTIGNNVVIGGGSVVVRDIPSDSVAVGNPCKVIRAITEEDKKTCWDR